LEISIASVIGIRPVSTARDEPFFAALEKRGDHIHPGRPNTDLLGNLSIAVAP
jgi:hypothetical protein